MLSVSWLSHARAQLPQTSLELSFTPTDRTQIAIWVERDDGQFMGTLSLTYAVAVAGIGNRPGALQMNSGFRWPYGRREGVLPVWAHRRAAAPAAKQFRRVIFQDRGSEGFASRTASDHSVDDYYCLSFDRESTGREALDAVTCASVFSSDKGRFITDVDVASGYAEPAENERGEPYRRSLGATSLYPPRRDVTRCTQSGCYDHADIDMFAGHAREVMPELDAISRATPQGERLVTWTFQVPREWSEDHEYVLYAEVNVEGDYNEHWGPQRFPTPAATADWDSWAATYGYPYRGQPSVVYALPFSLRTSAVETTSTPAGYGALEGQDGELRPIDATISNDPAAAPGSGADRLRNVGAARLNLRVVSSDPCAGPSPPEACGLACQPGQNTCGALFCSAETLTCQSYCAATPLASAVHDLQVAPHPDRNKAHMWARLSFRAAESARPIGDYEVRVRAEGGEWSAAFTPDPVQELLPVALDVCNDPDQPSRNRCLQMQAGTPISVDLAGLKQATRYSISVAPRDAMCNELGAPMIAEFTTPERTFSTVSPCFIATAAYGSPLSSEVSVLRRVRDRYLASHRPGQLLIQAYYRLGPHLAAIVREHDWLRAVARSAIAPLVSAARWWSE